LSVKFRIISNGNLKNVAEFKNLQLADFRETKPINDIIR